MPACLSKELLHAFSRQNDQAFCKLVQWRDVDLLKVKIRNMSLFKACWADNLHRSRDRCATMLLFYGAPCDVDTQGDSERPWLKGDMATWKRNIQVKVAIVQTWLTARATLIETQVMAGQPILCKDVAGIIATYATACCFRAIEETGIRDTLTPRTLAYPVWKKIKLPYPCKKYPKKRKISTGLFPIEILGMENSTL